MGSRDGILSFKPGLETVTKSAELEGTGKRKKTCSIIHADGQHVFLPDVAGFHL